MNHEEIVLLRKGRGEEGLAPVPDCTGGADVEVGGIGRLYTYCYTVTTRDFCIKMGSGESHFNVS